MWVTDKAKAVSRVSGAADAKACDGTEREKPAGTAGSSGMETAVPAVSRPDGMEMAVPAVSRPVSQIRCQHSFRPGPKNVVASFVDPDT